MITSFLRRAWCFSNDDPEKGSQQIAAGPFLYPFFHPYVPRFSPFQGASTAEKSLKFSPDERILRAKSHSFSPFYPLETPPVSCSGGQKFTLKSTEFEKKSQPFSRKFPRRFPLEGRISGGMGGDLSGNSSAKDTPWKRKNDGGVCGEGDRWKCREKLRKLSFLKLEIMLEMDIFRQTKWQNAQTSCSS